MPRMVKGEVMGDASLSHPPLEGEGRLALSEANARRGGVTVSAPDTAHEERLSPHPAANFIRPPGEGESEYRSRFIIWMPPQKREDPPGGTTGRVTLYNG